MKKSLLIIRLDAIGDYVLFRNFLSILRKSEKYKEYSITLLGNNLWKGVSLELDDEFVDKFIWIDRYKFDNDFFYLYRKLKELTANEYDLIVNPTYSREFFYNDNLVKIISAKEKIGSIGGLSLMSSLQKQIGDRYYTKLIDTSSEIKFEFERNKEFFIDFLSQKIEIDKPIISLVSKKINFDLPKKYIVLFIGANDDFRKWHIKKFADIALYLIENYSYGLVLCGGPNDVDDALAFQKYYKGDVVNLVGKTSLIGLLYILSNARFMLSNETSAPHFALALKVQDVLVLSNANHYGRFTPYPENISENYHVIYPPEVENEIDNYKYLTACYGKGSTLDINKITVETVMKKIEKVLNG